MRKIFISMGSNVENRLSHFEKATSNLIQSNIILQRSSSIYETEALDQNGHPIQENINKFLNLVIECLTELSPMQLLHLVKNIEKKGGRIIRTPFNSREIDIDILDYEGITMFTPKLSLPHPRILHRKFVLIPLYELNPNLKITGYHQSIKEILQQQTEILKHQKILISNYKLHY